MLNPLTGQNIDPSADSSDESYSERDVATKAVSDLLMAIGKGLFLVFLGYAIVDSTPVQLLNPKWQIAFAARLLGIGLLPLVGFAFVHLAAFLNPANRFYSHRLALMRQWAMVAAIGFLLLIPLQSFATWRAFKDAQITQQTLISQANVRLAPIKKAIESATSVAELQEKLSRIEGVRNELTPQFLSQPLSDLKKSILDNLERSENLYADRLGTRPSQIWTAIQAGARTLLVSLGYFIGFAAGAQPGRSSLTLSDMLSRRFQSLFGRRRRR